MEKNYQVNGITICVDDTEETDKQPIFLYHGLTDSKEGMYPVRDMLRDKYRVICVDSRGHGKSSHPEHYSLADHAKDFHALVKAMGFSKVNLLGYSMGSYIALASAEMDSNDIDHLVLVCTKPSGKTSSISRIAEENGLDRTTADQKQLMSLVMKAALAPTSLEKLDKLSLSGSPVEMTPEQKKAEEESVAGFDNSENFDKVTCKTLVISGEYDGINKPEWGKQVADGIKGAEYVEIPDAGHLVMFEQPKKLETTLVNFLENNN